jgi:hypothetical protein
MGTAHLLTGTSLAALIAQTKMHSVKTSKDVSPLGKGKCRCGIKLLA